VDASEPKRKACLEAWTAVPICCGTLGYIFGILTHKVAKTVSLSSTASPPAKALAAILNFQAVHSVILALIILIVVLGDLLIRKQRKHEEAIAYFVGGFCVGSVFLSLVHR
jgi:uncharacterized membrane protein